MGRTNKRPTWPLRLYKEQVEIIQRFAGALGIDPADLLKDELDAIIKRLSKDAAKAMSDLAKSVGRRKPDGPEAPAGDN